jgi:hypothetical protein
MREIHTWSNRDRYLGGELKDAALREWFARAVQDTAPDRQVVGVSDFQQPGHYDQGENVV